MDACARWASRSSTSAGIVTNGGVASTVRDAHVRDFATVLLSDGCAAFSTDLHEIAVAALRPITFVATINEAMEELRQ